MVNERLRDALYAAGLKMNEVAERLDVDPKTVERWVTQGRMPYPRHRFRLAALLDADEFEIWPEESGRLSSETSQTPEVVRLYAHRSDIDPELWTDLVDEAQARIDILVYAGLFLLDQDPHLLDRLKERADAGVRIRLLLGDPECRAVATRGEEEGIGVTVAAKVRHVLALLRPLAGYHGVTSRLHQTTLYNSIFWFDDQMLVNLHVYSLPAAYSPVLHLQRLGADDLFDTYLRNFERVWQNASPAWPELRVV